jgi:hypothetical protein
MAIRVARHALNASAASLQVMTDAFKGRIDKLGMSPAGFGSLLNEASMLVYGRAVLDPDAAELETWEAVVAAMQVGTAAFAAAQVNEGVVECRIVDEIRTVQATGPRSYVNAGNWLTTLWYVIVCRDQARMDAMCNVPIELLRASGAHGDEYVYHWVDSLQTYWLERPGLFEKLRSAIELSHPEYATIASRDLLQNILYQPIHLFSFFVRRDRDGFNGALREALELHKVYWTATEKRARSPRGAVALGPLAMACLAYDAGFPIDVHSEYLPKALLERAWVGEFET